MRWSPLLVLLLVAGCADNRTVAIGDVPVSVESVTTTEDASTGTFRVDCGRNEERHLNADNMVIAPGQPFGAHHTHEYVGNVSTHAGSTDDSLAAAASTCPSGDRSTYYWPALRLTDRTGHDEHAPGGMVLRTFDFPSCWDGRNTDSPSHRAHVEFPGSNGVCRAGTFPVPKLRVRVAYDVPTGRPYAIDSFPEQSRDPRTDHAMFVNAMSEALMDRVTACLNTGRTCS